MSGAIKKLIAAAILGLALTAAPLAAQQIRIEPIPPHVKPQWTPVPKASGVFWAPNIPTDVFRHGSKYYFYWAGFLYQGNKARGPWKGMAKVPAWFSEIDPSYFKTAKKELPTPPPGQPGGPALTPEKVIPIPPAPAPAPAPAPPPPKEEAPATPAAPAKVPKVM
jgi:hypothetical protein